MRFLKLCEHAIQTLPLCIPSNVVRKLTTVYATTVILRWGKVALDKTVEVTGTNDNHRYLIVTIGIIMVIGDHALIRVCLEPGEFKDAIALRYNLPLQQTPSHCKCGHIFSVEHALSCATGGYPSIRHNEVRDLIASMLKDVCHDVQIEPHLQPLSAEVLSHRSAITENGARLDISARGFWGNRFERSFFDVRVFNPSAQSNRNSSLQSVYRKHEMEKKRIYEQRILEVEHVSFTPLMMSATGGMGSMATTFYNRLASMLSEKRCMPYSKNC